MKLVRHNKTGNIYFILDENVIDSTNSSNDKIMVHYINLEKEQFVREKSEFWCNFSEINSSYLRIVDPVFWDKTI
jgi:hypothetical protein